MDQIFKVHLDGLSKVSLSTVSLKGHPMVLVSKRFYSKLLYCERASKLVLLLRPPDLCPTHSPGFSISFCLFFTFATCTNCKYNLLNSFPIVMSQCDKRESSIQFNCLSEQLFYWTPVLPVQIKSFEFRSSKEFFRTIRIVMEMCKFKSANFTQTRLATTVVTKVDLP